MPKNRKALLVFIIILVQSALAVFGGMTALSLTTGYRIPPGVHAGGAEIGGLDKAAAQARLDGFFKKELSGRSLRLVMDGSTTFDIAYSDIDAHIDSGATLRQVSGKLGIAPDLVAAYFGGRQVGLRPVISYNEGKLREKLIELSQRIDKDPQDASIEYEQGKLVRKADTNGLKLNIDNTVKTIEYSLSSNFGQPCALNSGREIQITPAAARLKDLDDIKQVISSYSTVVSDPEFNDSVRLAANAINGIILAPGGKGTDNGQFSFINTIRKKDADFQNDNEGYDQVASTLYAALLAAGIDKDAINRQPHKLAADYIEPGLDAWISGNDGDLKFRNTYGHKLAVFAEVNGDRLTVALAGSPSDIKGEYVVTTEITQKFDPEVVEVENSDLKPGEKLLLSQGKQGVLINVYRNKELISTDKYDAEKTIIQVGPDTGFGNDDK